jgi:hypothetical protein
MVKEFKQIMMQGSDVKPLSRMRMLVCLIAVKAIAKASRSEMVLISSFSSKSVPRVIFWQEHPHEEIARATNIVTDMLSVASSGLPRDFSVSIGREI